MPVNTPITVVRRAALFSPTQQAVVGFFNRWVSGCDTHTHTHTQRTHTQRLPDLRYRTRPRHHRRHHLYVQSSPCIYVCVCVCVCVCLYLRVCVYSQCSSATGGSWSQGGDASLVSWSPATVAAAEDHDVLAALSSTWNQVRL